MMSGTILSGDNHHQTLFYTGNAKSTCESMRRLSVYPAISDVCCVRILVATYRRAMDALEISDRLGIPIASCYRRVRLLEEAGLVEHSRMGEGVGRKMRKKYRSMLKDAFIHFEGGMIKMTFRTVGGRSIKFEDGGVPGETGPHAPQSRENVMRLRPAMEKGASISSHPGCLSAPSGQPSIDRCQRCQRTGT